MGIAIPQASQTSPFERLMNAALGVQQLVSGIGQANQRERLAQQQADEYERQKREYERQQSEISELDKPDSPLRASVERMASGFGLQIPKEAGGKLLYNVKETLPKLLENKAKSWADLENKKVEIGLQGQEHRKTELAKLDREMKNNPNKFSFQKLPKENQIQIEKLSDDVANKTAIKNEIDQALVQLKDATLSEDQKIVAGQNLLKTLNSTQGKDAVGAEEAKRLSSFLEFKIANFTQPGSFVGRDLPEFVDQVAVTSSRLGNAAIANKNKIDSLYGRDSSGGMGPAIPIDLAGASGKQKGLGDLIPNAHAGKNQSGPTMQDLQAMKWLQANPKDPNAPQVKQKLMLKGLWNE